jgi:hypothetical protein
MLYSMGPLFNMSMNAALEQLLISSSRKTLWALVVSRRFRP